LIARKVEPRRNRAHHSRMQRLFLALVLVAGCVPLSYTFTPASSQPVMAKPKGCKFEVVMSQPNEGYEEIGTLDYYNGEAPKDVNKFKKAVAEQVCQVGGEAVVATVDAKGVITKGSVIKFVHHAEPVKPISDMPTTQAPDTENPNKKK
jgi:hypothetical protein